MGLTIFNIFITTLYKVTFQRLNTARHPQKKKKKNTLLFKIKYSSLPDSQKKKKKNTAVFHVEQLRPHFNTIIETPLWNFKNGTSLKTWGRLTCVWNLGAWEKKKEFNGLLFCCDFVLVGQTHAKKIGSWGFKATFGYREMEEREEKWKDFSHLVKMKKRKERRIRRKFFFFFFCENYHFSNTKNTLIPLKKIWILLKLLLHPY